MFMFDPGRDGVFTRTHTREWIRYRRQEERSRKYQEPGPPTARTIARPSVSYNNTGPIRACHGHAVRPPTMASYVRSTISHHFRDRASELSSRQTQSADAQARLAQNGRAAWRERVHKSRSEERRV